MVLHEVRVYPSAARLPREAQLDLFQSPVNNFIEPSGGDRMAMTS
jgi:hypothetical protein